MGVSALTKYVPRMISYDESAQRAQVMMGGEIRQLAARRVDGEPRTYLIDGIACAFETGSKLWGAQVTFIERLPGEFSYYSLECYGFVPPGRGMPPHAVGFFDDVAKSDRGQAQGSLNHLRWRPTAKVIHKRKKKSAKKKVVGRKPKHKITRPKKKTPKRSNRLALKKTKNSKKTKKSRTKKF